MLYRNTAAVIAAVIVAFIAAFLRGLSCNAASNPLQKSMKRFIFRGLNVIQFNAAKSVHKGNLLQLMHHRILYAATKHPAAKHEAVNP
ncbi:hypothetical protein D3C81_1072630 [compost metagenome]